MRIKGHRGQLTAEHLLLMRIPRRYWEASFDRIDPETRKIIRGYLHALDDMLDRGEGLLLRGPNGSGKTSTAAYVAKEVRRTGASVLMATAASLRDSVFDKPQPTEDLTLLELARAVDFLVIDDLGKESANRFTQHFFENLLRERGANRLTTWITTNADQEGLEALYKKAFIEVLKELVVPVAMHEVNHRDDEQAILQELLGVGKRLGVG